MKNTSQILALGASLFIAGAAANSARADIAVNLNGQPLATGAAPMQVNGRTLVPMRDIFEALGAQLSWNPVAQTITAQKDLTKIQLAISNPDALVNGRNVRLEQPAILIGGRTYVPLRFVAEATGAQVDWNGPLQLVSIRSNTLGAPDAPLVADATNALGEGNGNRPSGNDALGVPYNAPLDGQNGAPDNGGFGGRRGNRDGGRNGVGGRRDGRNGNRNDGFGGAQVAAARTISIPESAVVPVSLDQSLSSRTARVGQTFTASIISRRLGDSEFPAGSKIEGRIIEAQPSEKGQPGVLDFAWTGAILPDGTRVPLRGQLTSLDTSNVQMTGGRIVASGAQNTNKLKVIGVGAGAGFVLGRVLGTDTTTTTILGAAGGYLFGKARDRKAQEATLSAKTTLGVRLDDAVRYDDVDNYASERASFLRVGADDTRGYDPNYYGYDTSASIPRDENAAPDRYAGYDYSSQLPQPLGDPNQGPIGVGDIYPADTNGNANGAFGDQAATGQQVAGYQQISIPDGAVVPVSIDQALSSATATVGQTFTASVISQRLGDSEFPAGSKLSGRVIEARPQQGNEPGTLDLEFQNAVLPDGTQVPLAGQLVSLDDKSVQTSNGRIVARAGANRKNDRLKIIGIGTAAGFVVGRVLKKGGILPSLLGALGGYVYGAKTGDKPAQAQLAQGAHLGVRLTDGVSYRSGDYATYRTAYLRQP